MAKFLQNYQQNEETPQEPANDLLTPLNSEIGGYVYSQNPITMYVHSL